MNKNAKLVYTALAAAVLCIVSPFTIPVPISPVPLSLSTYVIFTLPFVMPTGAAAGGTIIYLLIGTVGMPVFSGFMGGIGVLAGPTGGYLAAYPIAALICSYFIRFYKKIYIYVIGMGLSLTALYILGTLWFCLSQNVYPITAITVCVLPYLPADAVKIAAAVFTGLKLRSSKAAI